MSNIYFTVTGLHHYYGDSFLEKGMIVYYIYRMILYFPNSPMVYSKNNLIYLLFRHA